ncbi:MAG: cation diffusion facilitator family transporter [Candidatus Ozemobacteraceae bacterium]
MNSRNVDNSNDKTIPEKQKAMIASCAVEFSSFGLNLAGALLANSLTLWTNTLRVSLDAAAVLFALYVIRRIIKGKSHQFDYGLGKWENLSALFSAVIMLVALVFIMYFTVDRFIHPMPIKGTGFGMIVLLFYTCLNIWLMMRFFRLCHTESQVMEAQFILYRNATSASLVSLIAVAFSTFGGDNNWAIWFDPIGALIVCIIVFYGMITLFQRSLSALLDETLEESLQLIIIQGLSKCYSDYDQIHMIRTRRSGNQIFVELFLEYGKELSVGEMLSRTDRIKLLVEGMIPHSEVWVIPQDRQEDSTPQIK